MLIINFDCKDQLFGNKRERVVVNFNDVNAVKSYEMRRNILNSSVTVFPYG